MSLDINIQQAVYRADPNDGRLPRFAYVNVLILLGVAILLLAVRNNQKYFAVALTLFSVVGTYSIWSVQRVVGPIIENSRKYYAEKQDYLGSGKLDIVASYLTGKLVWIRAACLILLLLLVDLICWLDVVGERVGFWLHEMRPAISEGSAAALVPVISIMFFLLIGEGSQWFMRVRTKLLLSTFDYLGTRYSLRPVDDSK